MAEVGNINPLTPISPLRREDRSHDSKGSFEDREDHQNQSPRSSPLTGDHDQGEQHIDAYA